MKTKRSNYFERIVKISITVIMISITALMVFGVASYFYFTHDLPSIETLKNYKPSTITKIFSEEGEVIGEFFYEKREVVSLDRVPNHLIQAFVAGEDARFFQHKGLDYLGILRALYRNIFSGEIVQGGSTITQQVVKSLLLSPERRFARKIREAILAYRIEKYLTKEEILFLYLNQIYFEQLADVLAVDIRPRLDGHLTTNNPAKQFTLWKFCQSDDLSDPILPGGDHQAAGRQPGYG